MENQEKIALSERLRVMDVGETSSFPIQKLLSVRTLACNLGVVNGRRFTTRTDRENGCVYVTRVS